MSRRYDWNAPATLIYWPESDDLAERDCSTLWQAILEANTEAGRSPWIVTRNGEILRPREIALLQLDTPLPPSERLRLSFLRPLRHSRPGPAQPRPRRLRAVGLG